MSEDGRQQERRGEGAVTATRTMRTTNIGPERVREYKRLALALAVALGLSALVLLASPDSAHADHICVLNPPASYSVNEGGSVTLSANSSGCTSINWDFDNDGQYDDATGETVTFSAGDRDGPGNQIVRIEGVKPNAEQICESDPEVGQICYWQHDYDYAETTVNILNVVPTAAFSAPQTSYSGKYFIVSLTDPYDPSSADRAAGFTYAFDCGRGSGYGAFTGTSVASCQAGSAGTSQTVKGKIRDKDGGVSEHTSTVSVTAAPPSYPNGDIAFIRNAKVHTKPPDRYASARLVSNSTNDGDPSYAPDGTKIAFSRYDGNDTEIYVMNANGAGVTRLTDNAVIDSDPSFSPDGTKIAFASNRDANTMDIYVMNADGTGGVTRLTNHTANDYEPAWSPEGSTIAFMSDRSGSDVYAMNADGTGVIRLTNDPAYDGDPAWSPEGSKIVFASQRGGGTAIHVMNADGTNQTRLTSLYGDLNGPSVSPASPSFSPDGSKIVYDHDGDLHVMNADGSNRTYVTLDEGQDKEAAWGPKNPAVPETTITSAPPRASNSNSATFEFSSSEPDSVFECSLGGDVYTPCSSPKTYANLPEGEYLFEVRAINAAGNEDPTSAFRIWRIDFTPPSGTISINGDAAYTTSDVVSLNLSANDPSPASGVAGMRFSNDGVAWTDWGAYATSWPYWALGGGDGEKTVRVQYRDAAGNVSATAQDTIRLDTAAPETTLDPSGPSGTVSSTSATFAFSSNEADATFECRVYASVTTPGSFSGCSGTGTHTESALVDGSYTFEVRARDGAGHVDDTPASRTWTVDLTAPTVTGVTPTADATNVALSENVTATFSEAMNASTLTNTTFTLTRQGAASAVTATVSYDAASRKATLNPEANLEADALYTATVKGGSGGAKDAAGNPLATDRVWSFRTAAPPDTTPPNGTVVIDANAPFTKDTLVTLTLNATDPSPGTGVDSMRFSDDGDARWTDWESYAAGNREWDLTVGDGTKTVHVEYKDGAGNIKRVEDSIELDTTKPDTTLDTSGPSGTVNTTSASFSFSSEAGATFVCSLDGAAFAGCSSPKGYTNLKNGSHTFHVRVIDAAGNVDATPAVRAWTVDTIKPTVSGMSPKHRSVIRDKTPTIKATVRDNLTNLAERNLKLYVAGKLISARKYTYSVATDRLTYNSPRLALGKKTVKIVATDAARNVGTKSWYFKIR
jgi:hypothetical protein